MADDTLVHGEGKTLEAVAGNHDERFRALLEGSRQTYLRLHRGKLKYRLSEIPFVGHLLSGQGLKVHPSKVAAVVKMPDPDNVSAVKRFIGKATYLPRYIPNLSSCLEPLRQLLTKDSAWNWGSEHVAAVEQVKKAATSAPTLQFFDAKRTTVLQCDASEGGLGAVLMQDGHPVAFASKSLSLAERSYGQIEKELLAVVLGAKRFHQYVYGRPISVESDHKPLEIILKKPLQDASKRLQRMMLALQGYDITCTTYREEMYR